MQGAVCRLFDLLMSTGYNMEPKLNASSGPVIIGVRLRIHVHRLILVAHVVVTCVIIAVLQPWSAVVLVINIYYDDWSGIPLHWVMTYG